MKTVWLQNSRRYSTKCIYRKNSKNFQKQAKISIFSRSQTPEQRITAKCPVSIAVALAAIVEHILHMRNPGRCRNHNGELENETDHTKAFASWHLLLGVVFSQECFEICKERH